MRFQNQSGTWRWFDVRAVDHSTEPDVDGTLYFGRDISDRVLVLQDLEREARRDPLTNLLNRAAVLDDLEVGLAEASPGNGIGVLFCDLDDFKAINDTLGHTWATRCSAGRHERSNPPCEMPTWWDALGGDEFLIIARSTPDETALSALADRLRHAWDHEFATDDFTMSVSIGGALATEPTTSDEIVRNADLAMYEAKRNGKATTELFRPALLETQPTPRCRASHSTAPCGTTPSRLPTVPSTSEPRTAGCWRRWKRRRSAPRPARTSASNAWRPSPTGTTSPTSWPNRSNPRWPRTSPHWRHRGGLIPKVFFCASPGCPRPDMSGTIERLTGAGILDMSDIVMVVNLARLRTADDFRLESIRSARAAGALVASSDLTTGTDQLAALRSPDCDLHFVGASLLPPIDPHAATDPVDSVLLRSICDVARVAGSVVAAEGIATDHQLDAATSAGGPLRLRAPAG